MIIKVRKGRLNGVEKHYVYVNGKLKGAFWLSNKKSKSRKFYKNKYSPRAVSYKKALRGVLNNEQINL